MAITLGSGERGFAEQAVITAIGTAITANSSGVNDPRIATSLTAEKTKREIQLVDILMASGRIVAATVISALS